MEYNVECYIYESKIESLEFENLKLKQEVYNLKKLINHIFEGKIVPEKIKKVIDN